jgi:2-keto-4-pentenoate hydratase/2-oxohepta-3-ene-1,7-dioic acid hydratase in catechol pathway
LARFQTLDPGDLLLIGSLLPPAVKWKAFFKSPAKNPRYLRQGDVVTATIATPDGRIDLGEQRTPVADSN